MHVSRLRAHVEKLISGRPSDDPLCVTNRNWRQKLGIAALAAVPAAILLGLLAAGATGFFHWRRPSVYNPPAAEAHSPELKLAAADLDVVSMRILRDPQPVLEGVVRNNTNRAIDSALVSYYLLDENGVMLGTDTAGVKDIAPHSTAAFQVPLKSSTAASVTVREVRAN